MNVLKEIRTENSSSHGHNLAVTVLYVPSLLESGTVLPCLAFTLNPVRKVCGGLRGPAGLSVQASETYQKREREREREGGCPFLLDQARNLRKGLEAQQGV